MQRNPVKERLTKLMAAHPDIKGNATALSRYTGVQPSTITRILTGEVTDPRASTLKPIADFFGVPVNSFWQIDEVINEQAPAYIIDPVEQQILAGTRDLPANMRQVVLNLVESLKEATTPVMPKARPDMLSKAKDKKATHSQPQPAEEQRKK